MEESETRRLRLILNGKSAGEPAIREAVAGLRGDGASLQVRVTWEAGDAARYAREAADSEVDVVIAGGGDGTINEVVSGLLDCPAEKRPALSVLPLGTANDFATGLGFPTADPLAALELARDGRLHSIDIGSANGKVFVNVASGGYGAEVTANTPPKLKRLLGGAAYTLMGVVTAAKMSPYQVALTLPSGERHEGSVIALAVANGRQCGGGVQVGPQALLDDGLLDLVVVHDIDFQSVGQAVSELFNVGDEANEFVSYVQIESFTIECDQPMQVNLDGEPVRNTKFEFRVLPNAIRIVLPPDAPPIGTSEA